jgi:BASS family bile acid:Na+ symporter
MILALILGLTLPSSAIYFKNYTLYILAVVMVFSTSGISFNVFADYKSFLKSSFISIFLNYLIHGIIVISLSFIFFDDYNIILGFVVIAATPPGVAIIPFTLSFKGDENFSLKGILGTYLAAIAISPIIIELFSAKSNISPLEIIYTILQVILIPILLSRILRLKKIYPFAEKIRGRVADIGFALILYTAIAINRNVIFKEIDIVLKVSLILFIAMFVAGYIFNKIMKKRIPENLLISQNLMLTIKSSGFAIATSMTLFGGKSAIAPAVMSVFVLLYLLYKGIVIDIKNKNIKV